MRTASEEINRAGTLANTLQDLIGKKGSITIVHDGHGDRLLMQYWSVGFDLFKGMLTAMREKFYTAGFALMRPLLEANLRAHLIVRGDKDDVEKMRTGDYKMNFDTVGAQIDAFFGLEGYMQTLLDRYAKTFHGFTHSGLEQIARHYDASGIGACYDEEEVI